jgi:ABC-2 type transport system ATP-binding protein
MDVLTLRNLHKAFGRQKVLQGIDLTVPQHSIFGFIGKNGAGKTTTMKTILGLEKADAGELYIMQEPVVFGNTRTNRYIGYVSDVPEFYGFMTAWEYLLRYPALLRRRQRHGLMISYSWWDYQRPEKNDVPRFPEG